MISNFYQNTYIHTSSELKRNLSFKHPIMMFGVFLELVFTLVFGIYFEPNFYGFPFALTGIIGTWYYRPNFILAFQLYNLANVTLRTYTIFLTGVKYLWIFIIIDHFIIYKFWKFREEIKTLIIDDIESLRKGWQPNSSEF